MNVTFQIPDELYREFKSETARDGRTVREVAIQLFEQWLRQKKQTPVIPSPTDWQNFQPPLAHLVPSRVIDHSNEAIRKSINAHWNEPV
jgi:hypothetical protein